MTSYQVQSFWDCGDGSQSCGVLIVKARSKRSGVKGLGKGDGSGKSESDQLESERDGSRVVFSVCE